MTDIEKLESPVGLCICMAYFCGGLALGIFLMADNMSVGDPEWIAGITICVIGIALVRIYEIIRKKIEMESTGGDGE